MLNKVFFLGSQSILGLLSKIIFEIKKIVFFIYDLLRKCFQVIQGERAKVSGVLWKETEDAEY